MKFELYYFFYEQTKRNRNLFYKFGRMRPDEWPPKNWKESEYDFFYDRNKRKVPLWLRDCPTVEYWQLARRFVEPLMRKWLAIGKNPLENTIEEI